MQVIDQTRIADLQQGAAASARLRKNDNLHATLADPVQRFLNALEPGSYVRPHRHSEPRKWEMFLILTGRAAVLEFDAHGRILRREELAPEGPIRGVEIPAGRWHTLLALRHGTVLLELKPGPYTPVGDKDFADWAPAEGSPAAEALLRWLAQAAPGDDAAPR